MMLLFDRQRGARQQADATFSTIDTSIVKTEIMQRSFCILLLMGFCLSCNKETTQAGQSVEIYLLKSYQYVVGKCQVDPSSIILRDSSLVRNQEITSYSKTDYQFELTDVAIQKVAALTDKTPFAVTIDKNIIYCGFFKPLISSSSCDHSITMSVDQPVGKIRLSLGYPWQVQNTTVNDQRNNSSLLATLKNQNKLR